MGLVVVLGIVRDDVIAVPLAKRRIFETVDGRACLRHAIHNYVDDVEVILPVREESQKLSKDPLAQSRAVAPLCGLA